MEWGTYPWSHFTELTVSQPILYFPFQCQIEKVQASESWMPECDLCLCHFKAVWLGACVVLWVRWTVTLPASWGDVRTGANWSGRCLALSWCHSAQETLAAGFEKHKPTERSLWRPFTSFSRANTSQHPGTIIKAKKLLVMAKHTWHPNRQRQEDFKFQSNVGYKMRLSQETETD